MSATRSFKKTVIAYHKDLAPQKKDDIRRWVEHAGGKVTSEMTDDVTHFILPRAIWHSDDTQVTEIRRRRTVFLIKFKWLSDSLSFNKKKPLDEVNQQYTWDVAHAKKVWDKRKDARRHKARIERAAAKEASKLSQAESGKLSSSTIEAKSNKLQEVIECGLKYDKKLLECERDMALSGYRPYVDNNGFLYMVTLVRDDIVHAIKEKYEMKFFQHYGTTPCDISCSSHCCTSAAEDDATEHLARFTINDNTTVRYFEMDGSSCRSESSGISDHRSGSDTSTRATSPQKSDAGCSQQLAFEQWEQHVPFSIYPIMSYEPDPRLCSTPRGSAGLRVYFEQSVAYSLQLYESFQMPMPELESPCAITPDSTSESHTSFQTYLPSTSSLPSTEPPSPPRPTSPSARLTGTNHTEKEYRLVCHYTKCMGKHRNAQTEDLVPRHSTFEFVMEMWRKFFKNKTKLAWDAALHGDANITQRQDSGVGLKDHDNGHNVKRPMSAHRLQGQGHTTEYSEKDPGVLATLAKADITSTYQCQPFQYIPNLTENIAHFRKRYFDSYGENWLTSHCTELKERSLEPPFLTNDNAIVPESKPEFPICDDHADTVCECVTSV